MTANGLEKSLENIEDGRRGELPLNTRISNEILQTKVLIAILKQLEKMNERSG